MQAGQGALCWICRPTSFGVGVCEKCERITRPYQDAWGQLARYLHAQWPSITRRGSFDLTQAFPGPAASQAVAVHLYFVTLLGNRLSAEQTAVDLQPFAEALRSGQPHAEVSLLVAACTAEPGRFLSYTPEVSVLREGSVVWSALWTHLAHPVAVKTCYLKAGAPVREPDGFPWHPTRQRKVVKLSPYKGDTRPLVARRDLRI